MKNLLLLISLLFISGSVFAQKALSPKKEKKIFVGSCTDTFVESFTESAGDLVDIKEKHLKKAAKNYCTCAYDTIKEKGYTMDDLNGMSEDKMAGLTEECLADLMAKIMPK